MAFWDKKMDTKKIKEYQKQIRELLSDRDNPATLKKIKETAKKLAKELENANSHILRNLDKEKKALQTWEKSLDKYNASGNDKDAKKSADAANKYAHYLEKLRGMEEDYRSIFDSSNQLLAQSGFRPVQPKVDKIVTQTIIAKKALDRATNKNSIKNR